MNDNDISTNNSKNTNTSKQNSNVSSEGPALKRHRSSNPEERREAGNCEEAKGDVEIETMQAQTPVQDNPTASDGSSNEGNSATASGSNEDQVIEEERTRVL